MSKDLEQLKFDLKKKEKELYDYRADIFVYNPKIGEVVNEIFELKKKIKRIEDNENEE